jgi:hypothetical protein
MILAVYIFLSNQSRSKPQEGCNKFLALHPGFRVLVQGQLNPCATMVVMMMMMMPHNFCTSITEWLPQNPGNFDQIFVRQNTCKTPERPPLNGKISAKNRCRDGRVCG